MLQEVIFAGFGGQGVLTIAKNVAYAAMLEEKETCWFPTYGPEMRGGTAGCTVTVSNKPVSSPILAKFDTGVILNQPSVAKYEDKIKSGGVIIWESSNIVHGPTRTDLTIVPIPAYEEAIKLGNRVVMGMVLLGAFVQKTQAVKIETILDVLKKTLPERRHNLIPLNEDALRIGYRLAEKVK
jgi:2-oxoglutarate ferredoxin oxidoreductase subunit gamma